MKTPTFRSPIGAVLLYAAVFALCPRVASAVGNLYIVDSTGDGDLVGSTDFCDDGTGHCTLRAALQAANGHVGADGIRFNLSTTDPNYNGTFWTIQLSKALPDVIESINLTGPGRDLLTIRRNTTGGYRIFNVTTAATVNFSGLTINNGASGLANGGFGGGIQNSGAATVNITNCAITGNQANRAGGGISNSFAGILNVSNCIISDNGAAQTGLPEPGGGGIFTNMGTVTITGSVITRNVTNVSGGGISILSPLATVNVSNSTITENIGGGISGAGIVNIVSSTISTNTMVGGLHFVGTTSVTVESSTISDNTAIVSGGGIFNQNGGTTDIANSTISGNRAGFGGGIWNDSPGGTTNLSNSTVTNNSANSVGGGLNNNSGTFNVKSTVVALNTAAGSGPDVAGAFISAGFNLIGIDQNNGFTAPTDLKGGTASVLDPRFDPAGLQNNGGPTLTIALLPESPAIDKGTSNGLTTTLSTDQRGSGFPRAANSPGVSDADDGADIGAFEVQSATPTPTPGPTPQVSVTASPATVNEGGDAIFTFSAAPVPSQSTTVFYSIRGKAQFGTDFTLTGQPGQVVIPAGQSSATVTLHSLTDTVPERNEKAKIKLLKGAGYKKSRPKKATIIITNVP